jgi:hypothetical protein
MAQVWPKTSGKKFLAALKRRGFLIQEIDRNNTYAIKGPMTVQLDFGPLWILEAEWVGYWAERLGLHPQDLR